MIVSHGARGGARPYNRYRDRYERGLVDAADIRALIELNNRFYAKHAASFSATRTRSWDGWRRLATCLEDAGWRKGDGTDAAVAGSAGAAGWAPGEDGADGRATGRPDGTGAHRDILDLACGNLRFEAFLAQAFAGERIAAHAVDSCPALAQGTLDGLAGSLELDYRRVDVLDALLADPEGGTGLEGVPPCELAVCFGFMHHVPGSALRRALMAALCERVAPGGIVALSFWQYLRDPRLARRAAAAEALREEDPALAGLRLEAGDGFGLAGRPLAPALLPQLHRKGGRRARRARGGPRVRGGGALVRGRPRRRPQPLPRAPAARELSRGREARRRRDAGAVPHPS